MFPSLRVAIFNSQSKTAVTEQGPSLTSDAGFSVAITKGKHMYFLVYMQFSKDTEKSN